MRMICQARRSRRMGLQVMWQSRLDSHSSKKSEAELKAKGLP